MRGYIYCISYNIPAEEHKKYGRYLEIMGTPSDEGYTRYYIGASHSLPFYILIKRNNDLIYPHAPPHLRPKQYKCLFAKYVKDLSNEKDKLDKQLHSRCCTIMNAEQQNTLIPEHKNGEFVEMENTEDYKWHRPWSYNSFLPSILSLEYIRALFDLSLGDYIDIDIDNMYDSISKDYNEYVICERIEQAFCKLDKEAKEKKILQNFKELQETLKKINLDLLTTLTTFEELSYSTKDKLKYILTNKST